MEAEASGNASPMEVEASEQAPPPIFSLSLLQFVKKEQAQNGVKHGEFARYRKHCSNKLKALSKALKFQHGKHKFMKRKIDAETVVDERFLHILVFNAERAWAYATEMKKANESEMKLRRRDHLVRRMRKAAFWASELVRVGQGVCDERTRLEADAYQSLLMGNVLLESESDWVAALANFERARMLFEEMRQVVPLEDQTVFMQMAEETEPSIRFCSYQFERKNGKAPPPLAALLTQSSTGGRRTVEELRAAIAGLAGILAGSTTPEGSSAASGAAGGGAAVFEWAGRKFAVRNQRVRTCLSAASTAMTLTTEGEPEARLAAYARAVNAYNEARSHVRNTLQGSSFAEGEPAYDELVQLDSALHGTSLQAGVARQSLLVQDAEERFAAGLQRATLGKRTQEKDRYARAEEVVRMLESLGRALGDLSERGATLGGRAGEALHDAATAAAAAALARRCYYVAQSLLGAGKAVEAYALLDRADTRITTAREQLSELPSAATQAPPSGSPPGPAVGVSAALDRTVTLVRAFRAVAHAEAIANKLKEEEAVTEGVDSMKLAEHSKDGRAVYLLEALDTWESFAGQPGVKAPRLHRSPYAFAPIPAGPIMLDTAAAYVKYPDVSGRVTKAAGSSSSGLVGAGYNMASSLFGWGAKK